MGFKVRFRVMFYFGLFLFGENVKQIITNVYAKKHRESENTSMKNTCYEITKSTFKKRTEINTTKHVN